MNRGEEAIGGLLVAVTSSVVIGVAVLMILYRTIDGEIEFWPGMGAMGGCVLMLLQAVKPVHPAVPAIILVVVLASMAFFPFAVSWREKLEMQALGTDRLEKSYRALAERPDNFAVRLEIARRLYDHGFPRQGIEVAEATLSTLSAEMDPVTNRSLRDLFREEDARLQKWKRLELKDPSPSGTITCRQCKTPNPPSAIVCVTCGRPHLLDLARDSDIRPRIAGRFVVAFAVVAALIVCAASIGLLIQGPLGIVAFVLLFAAAALVFLLLFRIPKPLAQ